MSRAAAGIAAPRSGPIAVLGVPLDWNSSFLPGAARAPQRIREALASPSSNLWTENGIDLGSHPGWRLLDDLHFAGRDGAFACIEQRIGELLADGTRVISLGGDHSITYPIVRAYGRAYGDLSILQLDAHPDLYDEFDGNRHSHGCPFARIMEEGLAARLVQVGVRASTGHQRAQAARFGVESIEMREKARIVGLAFEDPVYLSIDLDCLDPAFAPGVSHREPGGLSTREVLELIQRLPATLVGCDIVECNTARDPYGMTATVAAKLLKELLGRMLKE